MVRSDAARRGPSIAAKAESSSSRNPSGEVARTVVSESA
jgi:hypothetical protein